MILSSNPRVLTCFVWGVSFFFDCCGRTSISCQNVGKVLLRRVSVVGAHRVVLRHVEIGTWCIWGAWLDNRTRYDFVRDILYKISFLLRFANCDDFHREFCYFLRSTSDIPGCGGLMHRDEMRRTNHIFLPVWVGKANLWCGSSCSWSIWGCEFRVDIPLIRGLG